MEETDLFRQRLYDVYASKHAAPATSTETIDRVRRAYLDRLIKRAFPRDHGARIFDLGCGDGALLRALARHGYRNMRGVDTSHEQVARAQASGCDVVLGDLLQTLRETSSDTIDVVVAFDVLEHFSKRELLEFCDQVLRVLRPGGSFIVHVPNGSALLGARVYFSDLTHETCFTPTSMRQLMNVVGFRDVQLEEDTPSVHGLKSATRWLLWQAIRQVARCALIIETGNAHGAVFSLNLLALARK